MKTLLCGVVLLCCRGGSAQAANDFDAAKAAINAYKQHLDRIIKLKMYHKQFGTKSGVATYEDAANITNWKRTRELKFSFLMNGGRFKYTCDDPKDNAKKSPKLVADPNNPNLAWADDPYTHRYVTNGSETLSYDPSYNQSSLGVNGLTWDRSMSTPLHTIGFRSPDGNPYMLMSDADRAGRRWLADAPTQVEGAVCIPVTFDLPRGARYKFYLDPKRGYLPLRTDFWRLDASGNVVETSHMRTVLHDIREFEGGIYFPMLIVGVYWPDKTDEGFIGWAQSVDVFDPTYTPSNDDMSVSLPAGQQVFRTDKVEAKWGVQLRRGERVGPDDLHRFIEISDAQQTNPRVDTAVVLPKRPWWRYAVAAAGGLAALLGVGLAVRRYRRGAAS